MMRLRFVSFVAVVWILAAVFAGAQAHQIQFVFVSDTHYGITRSHFRGASNVDAHVVNQALVASINVLPTLTFAVDGGVNAGQRVGPVDFVAVGGDIANRMESATQGQIQRAAVSWGQFTADYLDSLTLKDKGGHRPPVYVVPGNHDVSNAIGFYQPMVPLIDKTAMVQIFNRMMAPPTLRTPAGYDYSRDKVWTTRDVGGVHFVFVTVWPDTPTREWLATDLGHVSASTPVVLFTHDQPDAEAKHFTNPNGSHDINARDRFENLLADRFADGPTIDSPSLIEQGGLEAFFHEHPNITAYFHGNSNWNQFYEWTGPHHTANLHVFRVDSPMKGAVSSKDETKLSFQIATIDTVSQKMTVRECLWNADPGRTGPTVIWGNTLTVTLRRASFPSSSNP
jgi:hypothetical protein